MASFNPNPWPQLAAEENSGALDFWISIVPVKSEQV
jgi:hypothetical protein